MRLFDPTGRMAAKRERQYASLRDMFASNGIDSVEKAEQAMARMRRSMVTAAVVLVLVPLAVTLLFPDAGQVTAMFCLLLLTWLGGTFLNARRHVRRYIGEELQGGAQPPTSS